MEEWLGCTLGASLAAAGVCIFGARVCPLPGGASRRSRAAPSHPSAAPAGDEQNQASPTGRAGDRDAAQSAGRSNQEISVVRSPINYEGGGRPPAASGLQ